MLSKICTCPEPPFVFEPDVLDEGFQSGTAKVGKVTTSERMVRVSSVSGINGNVVKYAIIVLQLPTGSSQHLASMHHVTYTSVVTLQEQRIQSLCLRLNQCLQ